MRRRVPKERVAGPQPSSDWDSRPPVAALRKASAWPPLTARGAQLRHSPATRGACPATASPSPTATCTFKDSTNSPPTVFRLVSRPLYEPRSLASVGVEQDVHVAGAVDAVHEVQLDVGRAARADAALTKSSSWAVRWYCLRRTRRSAALPAPSGPRLAGFPTIPGRICYERSRPAAPRGATPRWNESSSSRASEAAGDKDRERMVVPLITMRSPGRCGDHDPRRFRSSSALTVLIAGFHSLLRQCASTSRNQRGSFLSSAVTRRSRV
jgi:hypothetical protein